MRGRLKIVRLKTAVVEGNFDWTFVRIETDEGIQGLGECFFAPGLTSILRSLEPVILGEDCRDVRRLFRKLPAMCVGCSASCSLRPQGPVRWRALSITLSAESKPLCGTC